MTVVVSNRKVVMSLMLTDTFFQSKEFFDNVRMFYERTFLKPGHNFKRHVLSNSQSMVSVLVYIAEQSTEAFQCTHTIRISAD